MATMIQFLKGTQAGLNTAVSESKIVDGALYFTTDSHKLYMGTAANAVQEYSAIEVVDNLDGLPATTSAIEGKFYYAKAENVFCFPGADGWHQVNPDTGATSIEVVGSGNAVTAASYDAATRKITLTMGETFATREYVGEIPTDYTETNVVAYINKKAEEVLSQATGGSSESAASVKAALDAYKAENDPKVTQAQADIDALEEKVGEKTVGAQISEAIDALDLANTYDAKGAADAVDAKLTEEVARAKAAEEANTAAATAAKTAADAAQADVDALEGKVGAVPEDKTVVGMIAEAQTAATYDDTEVRGLIEDNAEAIGVLNGDETTAGSVKKTVADEIAKVIADAPESFDTLKEISDWISSHGEDAAAMNSAILALQGIVAGIGGESDEHKTVVAYVNAAIAALNIGDYALAADLTALADRVTALEGATHTHDNKTVLDGVTAEKVSAWDAAEDNAKAYADGLADNYDAAGAAAQALTDAQAYADAAETDAIASANSYTDGKLEWGTF